MKFTGKGGITATIIQDSICNGKRITTFELDYPRFIHSELMTHRQFSRNAASSRAIPIEKMHEHIKLNTAVPIHWGINQAGMQAKEELQGLELRGAKSIWNAACNEILCWSKSLAGARLHKQIANRITEPFQMMKTVVTATEWDNWYWLRDHEDAQPEIAELAKMMHNCHEASIPQEIHPGQWHVPYVTRTFIGDDISYYVNNVRISVEDARMVSASCCAQVSYRKSDDSLEKARMIFDRLINSEPVHASPVEHQASPMITVCESWGHRVPWEDGITHMDRRGKFWSGNFKGWIQFRQLIPNNSR
jgi:hypothetical protein